MQEPDHERRQAQDHLEPVIFHDGHFHTRHHKEVVHQQREGEDGTDQQFALQRPPGPFGVAIFIHHRKAQFVNALPDFLPVDTRCRLPVAHLLGLEIHIHLFQPLTLQKFV